MPREQQAATKGQIKLTRDLDEMIHAFHIHVLHLKKEKAFATYIVGLDVSQRNQEYEL